MQHLPGISVSSVAPASCGGLVARSSDPASPILREHLLRMRELRPGLRLHADDAHDEHDMTAQGEMSQGLRIVMLLEGAVDVSYGQRHVTLASRAMPYGKTASDGARALLVSVAEPDTFMRRTRKGAYARRLSIDVGWDWIAQAAGGESGGPLPGIQDFKRQHLAMKSWQVSARSVAIAEQIVRPPQFEPLLQNLYLESRALELVAEAFSVLSAQSGAGSAVVTTPAEPSLRPHEHQRMRELRAWLATEQADDLSLDDIARHAGTNANTLQKQFRALYGTTVFDYLRECRLQRARHALERDGRTVGQAAMLAGYTSAANFATAYKRRFGLSPKLARSRI